MQILISLDGSKLAEAVIPQAVALARATHNTITLLQVITPPSGYLTTNTALPENWYSETIAGSRKYLQAVAKGIQAIGVEAQIATIDGTSTSGILTYVEQHADVSLIAMASHGRDGIGRWFLGSIASDIIHSLPKPLLLIHPDNNETLQDRDIPAYHTIIVPLDGSMRSEHVLDYVKPLAKTFGATITLVQITQTDETQTDTSDKHEYLEQKAQQLRTEGFTVKIETPASDTVEQVQHLSEIQRGDVLVIAAHRKKVEGIVMNFIHNVGVPVLLLPGHHNQN